MKLIRATLVTSLSAAVLVLPVQSLSADSVPQKEGKEAALEFIKGYSFGWGAQRGDYEKEEAVESLLKLSQTGTEWIALCFAGHMEAPSSSSVLYGETNGRMVGDEEIRYIIRQAHNTGLRVALKPVVECMDGTWRAEISLSSAEEWDRWWESYRRFLAHYLSIASSEGCRAFVVGCEMRSTEGFEGQWRKTIEMARHMFPGTIWYNSTFSDVTRIMWWDAVDAIGLSAYYPVGTQGNTSLERMLKSWEQPKAVLRELCREKRKPAVFMEIGVRSAKGRSAMPWEWQDKAAPYDGDEQARYYEAALQSLWDDEPWFLGFFWWDWKARLHERKEAENNTDFGIYGKPAEAVLKTWYSKKRNIDVQPPSSSTVLALKADGEFAGSLCGEVLAGARAYSHDRTLFAQEIPAFGRGNIGIFNALTRKLERQVDVCQHPESPERQNPLKGLAWAPKGGNKYLACMFHHGQGGHISIVNVESGSEVKQVQLSEFYHEIRFSPDSNKIHTESGTLVIGPW